MNIYRHVKTGGLYAIIKKHIRIEADDAPAVEYMNLITDERWVRPESEFFDGRFQQIMPPDMLWHLDSPEDGPSDPSYYADLIGEEQQVVTMTSAISMPRVHFACKWTAEAGWICHPFWTREEAETYLGSMI